MVRFTPFRYIPLNRQLYLLTSVTITVDYMIFSTGDIHKLRPYGYIDEMAYEFIKEIVVNSDQVDSFYADIEGKINQYRADRGMIESYSDFEPTELPALEGSPVTYVIITNNTNVYGNTIGTFTEKFLELADWKTLSGSPSKVITVDAIRQAYPGVDIAEQIREFIKDAHHLWGTEYVLLGGNAPIIPVRWIPGMPTDLYYLAIWHPTNGYNDNWNFNGNNRFAENYYSNYSPDYADYTPDIAVGRAPVDTDNEVDLFLKKNFTYYRCSFTPSIPDGAWLNKQLDLQGIAFEVDWDDIYDRNGLKHLYNIIQNHYLDSELYDMFEYYEDWETKHPDWCPAYYPTYNNECTTNEVPINDDDLEHDIVINQINQRYGIINHFEHSGPLALGLCKVTNSTTGLTAYDFQNLSETNKYSVLISGGCATVPIQSIYYISEQWMNAPNGGVAFIGATVDFDAIASYSYNFNFYNNLYISNIYNIGWTNSFTANISSDPVYLYKIVNLLGDPELSIYTDVPVNINVTHNTTVTTSTSDFEVSVSGLPIGEEALVSMYKANEVQTSEYTSDNITFNITPDTPGPMKLTITCHNAEPYETTINVTQNIGVHLYKSDVTIIDENENGFIEPGETIGLSIELSNSGAITASDITGTLEPDDPGTAVMLQDFSEYPNIPPGEAHNSTANYIFKVISEEMTYGKAISFALNITCNQGNFIEPFFFNIKTARPEPGDRSVLVNDVETNTFNPGDACNLFIAIHNYGTIAANDLTAVLSTELNPDIVMINSGIQNYGDIESFEEITNTNPFTFNIGQNYNGEELIFQFTITDDFGKTDIFELNLTENPPDFIEDFDFSSGRNDITLYWKAVNNIKGYNIYRSELEVGPYEKINKFRISGTSMYYDPGLEDLSDYYYKISVISNTGNERNLDELAANHAWTSLNLHGQFPILAVNQFAFGCQTSVTVADVDQNGTKELFPAFNNGRNGLIMGFYETGQELFNIDGNETTVSGFAKIILPESEGSTDGGELWSEPAVGDVNNDGHAEVFVTTNGNYYAPKRGYLFGFKTVDEEEPVNQPDPLWEGIPIDLGHRSYSSPVLADLNGDGYLEIITNQEKQKISVFSYNGTLIWEREIGDNIWYSFGYLAVADLDQNGDFEIVFGTYLPGAIYIFNADGSDFNDTNPIYMDLNFRFDTNPVIANIHNNNELEIIIIGRNGNNGKLFAFKTNGDFVSGKWDGQINLTFFSGDVNMTSQPAIGDLNNDDRLEIAITDAIKVYVFDDLGNSMSGFPIEINNLNCGRRSPILADIDPDDDIEIIVTASNDRIYAFNSDGTECVGWRLNSKCPDGFAGTPSIADIDNDGLNELIISDARCKTFVWETTGDADKIEWGQYRHDPYNTGAYGHFCPYHETNPIVISDEEEWNENHYLQNDIIIESSGILIVHDIVALPEVAKIIIQVGGKLILDGGTLTNACTGPWQGVEVQGDPREEQIPNSNQGMISIVHEGTIENAKIGITVIDGGIVLADSANFINNHIAVEFRQYDEENISLFSFCEFKSNENCLPKAPPLNFVTLTDVNGVEFKACSFKNTWDSDYGELVERGNGIFSINSSFYVDYECRNSTVPCGDYQYNLFQGLNYGIYAIDIGYDNSIVVSHTEFMENIKGLYLSGYQNGIEVTSNDFNLYNTILNINSYGMYLDQCTGYHVEDNRFHNESVVGDIPGLYINNSGTEDNLIYNNRFDTLNYAIIAHNINRDDSQEKGLCIKCNDFRSDTYDISVTVSAPLVNEDYGIAEYQGSMDQSDDAPAGNTFTEHGSHDWDIYNEGNNIEYIHHLVSSTPLKVKPDPNKISENVNTKENKSANYDKEKSCPSMLFCGGGDKENLKSLLAVAETNIQAIQAELTELVDGGNTEAMNTDVLTSIPDEALEIHDQLLSESPYLSDTVMKSAISKENVLPNAMIRDVLVANPQAAKSEDVLTELDNRWDPMPDDMMDEIMAGKDSLGAKEILDSKLAKYSLDRSNAFHTLVRLYKNDTTDASAKDSLIAFLTNDEALQSKYSLTFLYQQFNDSIQADAVLNSIPDDFDLTGEQQVIHSNYMSLFGVLRALLHDSLSILELNESQINTLQLLAEDDQYVPGVFARNILLANGLSDYEEPVILPDPYKLSPINKNETKKVTTINRTTNLAIYPNPAKKYFIVEYQLEKDAMDIQIEILDMISRKVVEMTLHGQHDQVVVPVNNWHQGIYLVRLMANGRLMESRKVAVVDN